MKTITRLTPLLLLFTGACGDVEDDHDHSHSHDENEVITTVVLTFTPDAGGADLEFTWADPEDDGDPVIDPIVLPSGDYALSVSFLNELEDPAEDITAEIADEDDSHQVFFTGSGVEGPATGTNASAVITHAYADTDADGNPVGLTNDISTLAAGTGDLVVTLRHMPAEDGNPVKSATSAEDVASGGFASIGGDNDAEVTFPIEVQ
jgi:hypothetical protein